MGRVFPLAISPIFRMTHAACGSKESTLIEKTHPTLLSLLFINKNLSNDYSSTDGTNSLFRSVKDFLKNTADFPMQFDESLLFQDERAENLKNEFRIRFKNVTSIIDCAACEKCRLWGKLQTHGLGTALKVC